MTTIIVGTILVAICVLYGIASHRYARKDILLGVEAGPLQEDGVCHFPKYEVSSKAIKLMNGRYVNTRDYIRIVVHGNCMKPRNIQDGEEWLVEPLDKQKPPCSQIKEKDVLLIYLKDEDLYKIREFEGFNADGSLQTFYYESDGTKHSSSRPHAAETIQGVVRYAI